jgi:hypothetical protein
VEEIDGEIDRGKDESASVVSVLLMALLSRVTADE